MRRDRTGIGGSRAMVSAVVIVLYFALATVWLPSALLRSSLLTGVDRNVADLVALVVWIATLSLGMWMLRMAQDRGLI
jgi:hypothetical protein